MSYNTYIQSIDKKDFELISNFKTEKEIIDYVNKKDSENYENDEVYLAIKYLGENVLQITDINNELEKKISKKIFKDVDINKLAKNYGHQLFMIEKNDLLLLIELYQSEILRIFQKRITQLTNILKINGETKEKGLVDNKENYYVIKDFIRLFEEKSMDFGYREEGRKKSINNFPNLCLNSNEKKLDVVSNSSFLEYEIFNLVSLYNNFDFDEKILIIEAS